jgi:N-formylglutamate amidohydrolase
VKLPILLSVPHAGLDIPQEAAATCLLTPEQIRVDGDEGAGRIYALSSEVAAFVSTGVARAIVDMNRPETDRGRDGVIKTHTCWDEPVWSAYPSGELAARILDRYWRPYHRELTERAATAVLGVDCHTMAAVAPPIGPDPGAERPPICLSNADTTCPEAWFLGLADCLEETFGLPVARNTPFRGGYIVRGHAGELPWVQLELSRAPFLDLAEKRARVLAALGAWCRRQGLLP